MTHSLPESKSLLSPIFKWPGGKRWLARRFATYVAEFDGRYIEPFLGAGAMLFALQPRRGLVADINKDLIECYAAIRRDHQVVLAELTRLKKSKHRYLWARDSWTPSTPTGRAARFLFLLRHSWNGIYRVNRQGHFNVPYSPRGFKSQPAEADFEAAATVLRRVRILAQDFSVTIAKAANGDFIFADPPYFSSARDTFRRYHASPFDDAQQHCLADALRKAEQRGAHWVLTNGCSQQIARHLPEYECFPVLRPSTIAASSAARRTIEEYVVLSRSHRFDALRGALGTPI